MATYRDPLCGMQVEEGGAVGASEHEWQTYYFCSAGCKEKFDQNPKQYAGGGAQAGNS